jgi:hypothetical protein
LLSSTSAPFHIALPSAAARIVITRLTIGRFAFLLALAFLAWLALGILQIVPFVLELPGEPRLRVHAAAVVGCLLVAAWGFWE